MAREPDSFRVSTWPRRTTVENSSPSRTTHSAAVAPPFVARRTTSVASSLRSRVSFVSAVSNVVVIVVITDRNCRSLASLGMTNLKRRPTNLRLQTDNLKLQLTSLHESAGFALCGAADGHTIDFNCRDSHANGNGLSIFAAGANAFIEFQIVADNRK